MAGMKVELPYGQTLLEAEVPDSATVLVPNEVPALPDPGAAVRDALARPLGSPPLRRLAKGAHSAVIVISDITRPVPNQTLLPPVLDELQAAGVPRAAVTILVGTGLHRAATSEEVSALVGDRIASAYRIVSHDARDRSSLAPGARTTTGATVDLNRTYVKADVRVLTGFVEPHLFAGYSGGGKAVLPGVAGADTIMANHSARNLFHPGATWCVTDGNPVFEEIRHAAISSNPTFAVNVTLSAGKRITGVFAGDLVAAHDAGIAQAARQALRRIPYEFDIAVVTNMGYPADLNLYQSVKGLSLAAKAVRHGGAIILVAECREGLGGREYVDLLRSERSPGALLQRLEQPGFSQLDQWGVQILAMVQGRADVYLQSALSSEDARVAHVTPCDDVSSLVAELVRKQRSELGREPHVLVLPHGQLTVPVVAA